MFHVGSKVASTAEINNYHNPRLLKQISDFHEPIADHIIRIKISDLTRNQNFIQIVSNQCHVHDDIAIKY